MRRLERSNPLAAVAAAAMGAAIGLLVQFALSSRGAAPFVPPYSLPITLVLIGAVLLGFAIRLRRTLAGRTGRVNPFQAVRLLAAARAGQLVGALLGGFGAGLALSLLGRSIPAPVATWLPMLIVCGAGAVLVACAAYAEHACRIPPDDEDGGAGEGETDPGRGPVDQAAYRKP
ncbi:DUF3180 domain-containing protein [Leucobacter allii]|uniref:DUF3180 domain-containing protein n=1 Tax=Leucobacter allii TaxID=2932247 RepID=A0ABY4FHX2_9MICO|nr:DUF3180 family protein [Leucobacter allii]UOQ56275.1 DUF3180 domain-containing protein [Leucobacter allii]UOR00744.1 DUF3180 domain-containing protein [Leucobacter allii]